MIQSAEQRQRVAEDQGVLAENSIRPLVDRNEHQIEGYRSSWVELPAREAPRASCPQRFQVRFGASLSAPSISSRPGRRGA